MTGMLNYSKYHLFASFPFNCAIFYFHLRSTCMPYYAASTPFYTKYKLWINKQNARQASSLKDIAWIIICEPQDILPFGKDTNFPFPHANLQLVNSFMTLKSRWQSEGQTLLSGDDRAYPEPAQWVSTMFLVESIFYMLELNTPRSEMP